MVKKGDKKVSNNASLFFIETGNKAENWYINIVLNSI